jgi:hypothetical protein
MENTENKETLEEQEFKRFENAVKSIGYGPVGKASVRLEVATRVYCSMLGTPWGQKSEYRMVADHAIRATDELIKAYVKKLQ